MRTRCNGCGAQLAEPTPGDFALCDRCSMADARASTYALGGCMLVAILIVGGIAIGVMLARAGQ